MKLPTSILTKKQTKKFGPKHITYHGDKCVMTVNLRYDDSCNNGHNTFAITGNIDTVRGRDVAGGCIHGEIAKYFPELAHLIQWHLVSSDSPMHYIANTLYHATDKDHYGYSKGEPCRWEKRIYFGDFPIALDLGSKSKRIIDLVEAGGPFDLVPKKIEHEDNGRPGSYQFDPKFGIYGLHDAWYECPWDTEEEALAFINAMQNFSPRVEQVVTGYSKGKEPDLEAARRSAKWPEAELADFTKENLEARLPALVLEFKNAMEEAGFVY